MLADAGQVDPQATGWLVLIDRDTYPLSEREIDAESQARPLPARFRFTVAHELVHSIAFRPGAFGVRLRNPVNSESGKAAVVEAIENATDRLGPLLLVSERLIVEFLQDRRTVSIADIVSLRSAAGVSRQVLINRLRLLSPSETNGVRAREAFRNLAIVIGEWVDARKAILRSWPVFASFERNLFPAVLAKISAQDRVPAVSVFPNESFAPCGGDLDEIEIDVDAGTPAVPDAERMTIRCAIERVNRRPGASFLMTVQKLVPSK